MKETTYPSRVTEQLKQVEKITDKLGMSVDDGIKLLVAALRAYGFVTEDSCAGHEARRTNGPRVWISSNNSVKIKRDLKRLDQATVEAKEMGRQIEINGLHDRGHLLDLLSYFYEDRDTGEWMRIIVEPRGLGDSVLICQGTEVVDAIESDDLRQDWLRSAQAEFAAFTDFLVDRISKGHQLQM